MKALLVARKILLEVLREPQLLLLELILPIGFLALTLAMYSAPLLVTHPILIQGIDQFKSQQLSAELTAQHYASGVPMFEVKLTDDTAAALAALRNKTATALIALDPRQSLITVTADALSPSFYRASVLLDNVVTRYTDRLAGRPQLVRITEQSVTAAGPQNNFDLYAPGIIIFALLMIIPQTAMLIAREIRWRTLRRLRLTCLRAWDLLAGISLAQMIIAVLQVVIIFVAALLLGFHTQGSLLLAIVVGLAISFSAIGLGLIVACFIENDSQAANIGATAAMLQVFLSGSFFQLPPLTLFTMAGHQIDLFDIFPATHGFSALQQVLTYGAGLQDVAFRLGATLGLAAVYFSVGVLVFQRRQMRQTA
ncbi:MAG: ABC transporter permease [Chloroflexi bacterium]|nr:ABC transporter permease [Chloroflexota bacterium]